MQVRTSLSGNHKAESRHHLYMQCDKKYRVNPLHISEDVQFISNHIPKEVYIDNPKL